MDSRIFIPIILANLINDIASISCNFQYIEYVPTYPSGEELERLDLELENHTNTTRLHDSFSCEEDSYYPHRLVTTTTTTMTTKVSSTEHPKEYSQESHEYEDIESSCEVRRRTIQPKALNNIYNKLIKVVNTETFVQSIHIEECLNTKQPCNHGVVPTQRDRKYICRQKFVKITLKALSETNAVVDDFFYYPSHCVCELVTVKKKTKKPNPTKRCFFV